MSDAAEYEDPEVPATARPDWKPETLEDIDWCLSRIADLESELAEVERLRLDAMARVKHRAETLSEKARRGIDFFSRHVETWCSANRSALLGGGKRKSRDLLSGTVGWRKAQDRVEVIDADAALAWAEAQPVELGLVEYVPRLNRAALKQHVLATGEVPPGVEFAPGGDQFHLKAERTAALPLAPTEKPDEQP